MNPDRQAALRVLFDALPAAYPERYAAILALHEDFQSELHRMLQGDEDHLPEQVSS
jgi:hypothetical protein